MCIVDCRCSSVPSDFTKGAAVLMHLICKFSMLRRIIVLLRCNCSNCITVRILSYPILRSMTISNANGDFFGIRVPVTFRLINFCFRVYSYNIIFPLPLNFPSMVIDRQCILHVLLHMVVWSPSYFLYLFDASQYVFFSLLCGSSWTDWNTSSSTPRNGRLSLQDCCDWVHNINSCVHNKVSPIKKSKSLLQVQIPNSIFFWWKLKFRISFIRCFNISMQLTLLCTVLSLLCTQSSWIGQSMCESI